MRELLRELKRRNVYRVAVVYGVVGFVLVQVADLVFPALEIPSWAYSLVVVLVLLGFPVAVVLAWAFDLTPEGVRRTPAAPGADGEGEGPGAGGEGHSAAAGSRLAVRALVALGLLAAAGAGVWYLTGSGGGTAPRAGERSIAVLPFENLSGSPEAQPLVNGLHDDLLTRLSNISGLKVISRTSVMPYADTRLSLPAIADSLGVKWVMEGGVQQVGGQIQVNAQLIDPRTDTHAWADRYRREFTSENLFAIQSEITKRIAGSLEARIGPGEEKRVERRPTEDLEAYRLYVRGRTHMEERTERGLRRGMELFRRAIARDSGYAPAWAGLADAHTLLASYGHASPEAALPEAEDAARRALELNPELAEGHASLGLVQQDRYRDGPASLASLERATELRPSYARAHHWMAIMLAVLGRPEEALTAIDRAVELDPLSPSIHVARAGLFVSLRRPADALREARRARELAPAYPTGSLYVGVGLSMLGRTGEARAPLRRALEIAPPGSIDARGARMELALTFARGGDTARARELLAEIEEAGDPLAEGMVGAALGEREAALGALERAHYVYQAVLLLRYHQALDPLRDDPRFRRLLRRVNQEWGLEPDGGSPGGG